jgi:hypothetical protein
MRNFSNSFRNNERGFLGNISLSKEQIQFINLEKTKILEYLRKGIHDGLLKLESINVEPRFMSQGSAVYKTRNDPSFTPPQHIDHDLGCYLPLSIAKEISDAPKIASKVFFNIVDDLLNQLVKKEGWVRVDTSKKTCSRVILNNEVHIDIPLYAIPDAEFSTINEKVHKSLASESAAIFSAKVYDSWKKEDVKKVLLAHREQNWKESDPRKLSEYFKKAFQYKGEQLRRICRYLKAWRDFNWKDCGPSSIYLMILADNIVYAEMERDDLALLNVLKGIYTNLCDGSYCVKNPTDVKETIEINASDRKKLLDFSKMFSDDLYNAIYNSSISEGNAIRLIQRNLGTRFPDKPSIRDIVLSVTVTDTKERTPSTRTRAG